MYNIYLHAFGVSKEIKLITLEVYRIVSKVTKEYYSGVEERYLGRLITSRSGFDSRPRNKLTKNTPEGVFFVFAFARGVEQSSRRESKAAG